MNMAPNENRIVDCSTWSSSRGDVWPNIRTGYHKIMSELLIGIGDDDKRRNECEHAIGLSDDRWSRNFDSVVETKISCGRCSQREKNEKSEPCSENCNCFLVKNLMQLKTKLVNQSRILEEIATSNEVRCHVKLTPSEEKLFGVGTVKDDSMVCCVLVRELRSQKRDLESMMVQWVEFVDKTDRFAVLTAELRDKLAELTPRIESIFRETKVLEEMELENEEERKREIDEELRRSEERRQIIREALHRYAETEAHDRTERLARREKLESLERDRLMDRGALQLALRRMMKAMGAQVTPESAKIKETTVGKSVSHPRPETNETSTPTTAARDATPRLRDIRVSLPGQSGNHDDPSRAKYIPFPGSEQNRFFHRRTTARRPF